MYPLEPMCHVNGSRCCRKLRVTAFVALVVLAESASAACTFRNPLPGGILFGNLDPSVGNTRTATSNFRVQCGGGDPPPAWTFSSANGGPSLNMKHASTSDLIPYSAAASSSGGPPGNQQWVVTATVLGTSYINARVGNYSDTLTVLINP